MFDSEKIARSGAFPLDYAGVPVSGALRYQSLFASILIPKDNQIT